MPSSGSQTVLSALHPALASARAPGFEHHCGACGQRVRDSPTHRAGGPPCPAASLMGLGAERASALVGAQARLREAASAAGLDLATLAALQSKHAGALSVGRAALERHAGLLEEVASSLLCGGGAEGGGAVDVDGRGEEGRVGRMLRQALASAADGGGPRGGAASA